MVQRGPAAGQVGSLSARRPGLGHGHRRRRCGRAVADVDLRARRPATEYTFRAPEAHPDRLWSVGIGEDDTNEQAQRENVQRVMGHGRMVVLRLHACFEYWPTPGALHPTADWIEAAELDPL